MKFVIDRFEEQFAIVELNNKEILEIPRKLLPEEAKEGDIIVLYIDKESGEERRRKIEKKFDKLFTKN